MTKITLFLLYDDGYKGVCMGSTKFGLFQENDY